MPDLTTMTAEWVAEQREHNYRRTPARRVQTVEEVRAFVQEAGFCHFWPIQGVEMPNLFHAIAGRVRSVPNEHDDPDIGKCWGRKDESLDKHWWYYGKLIRRRATMVSLDLLPAFYACSDNFGDWSTTSWRSTGTAGRRWRRRTFTRRCWRTGRWTRLSCARKRVWPTTAPSTSLTRR